MRDDELLFHKYDFSAAIRNAPTELGKTVDKLADSELMTDNTPDLVNQLVQKHAITVPVLDVDGITVDEGEVQVDVGHNPRYGFADDGSHYIKATEYRFFVPYSGERDVFYCRPSTYGLNPPRAEVRSGDLVIRIIKRDQQADASGVRAQFDKEIEKIKEHLDRLSNDVAGLDQNLRQTAMNRIEQRRAKREQDKKIADDLGFPRREQS